MNKILLLFFSMGMICTSEGSQLYLREMQAVRPSCVNPTSFTITFTAAGGTGEPYTYSLTTVGTVPGGPFVQIGSPSTTYTDIPASPGTYILLDITDGTSTITLEIGPPLFYSSITNFDLTVNTPCNGGQEALVVNTIGTLATGTVEIDTYQGPNLVDSRSFTGSTIDTSINLSPGTYDLFMYDDSCGLGNQPILLYQFIIPEPSTMLQLQNVTATNPPCFGETGFLSYSVSGGTPTYSTCYATVANPTVCLETAIGSSGSFNDITPGSYILTTTDAANCTANVPFTISSSPCPANFLLPTNANVMAAQIGNPSCTNLICQPQAYPMVTSEFFDLFGTTTTNWFACNLSQFILFLLTQGQKLNVPGFVNMTTSCLAQSKTFLDNIAPAICSPCIEPCIPCAPAACPSKLSCPTCTNS